MGDKINSWHIVSYPRSGNHLVRTLVEYSSKRPTLGVIDSPKDIPIYLRPPNQNLNLIQIADFNPIAYKSHFLSHIRLVEKFNQDPFGLVLVQRKIENAVTSHLYRSLRKRLFLKDSEIHVAVEGAVNQYFSVLHFFESYDRGPKIKVSFEEIASSNIESSMNACKDLLGFLGMSMGDINSSEFKKLTSLARESQSSAKKFRKQVLEKKIRDAIARYMSISIIFIYSNLQFLFDECFFV
jgi:hypothetical protein